MEILQGDWIDFIANGKIAGAEAFAEGDRITVYDGIGKKTEPFPLADLIRETRSGDLFDRVQKDFMRGRDRSFIA